MEWGRQDGGRCRTKIGLTLAKGGPGTDRGSLRQKGKLENRNLLPGRWRKEVSETREGGRLGEEGEVSCAGHSLRLGWGGADNGERI